MKYGIKKLGTLMITLLVVSFLTFIAFEILPGDSAQSMLGMDATEEEIDALREELGYNDPVLIRYGKWISRAITGDFGISTRYQLPVDDLIKERLQVTVGLAVLSIFFIVVISVPLGVMSGKAKGSKADTIITFLTQFGMAIPPFFLGILITLIFGILLHWFMPGKMVSMEESMSGYIYYLLFPALAIAIPKIAMMIKFLRSSVLRQMNLDYVRTAKSKGCSERQVLYHHVLKNALIPVITFMAMIVAEVLAGSIVVEQVFNLPGLGRLLVVAISSRDFPVVQAIILYMTTIVLSMNMIVDLLYSVIDPRVTKVG